MAKMIYKLLENLKYDNKLLPRGSFLTPPDKINSKLAHFIRENLRFGLLRPIVKTETKKTEQLEVATDEETARDKARLEELEKGGEHIQGPQEGVQEVQGGPETGEQVDKEPVGDKKPIKQKKTKISPAPQKSKKSKGKGK